jgi:hypothetical protein
VGFGSAEAIVGPGFRSPPGVVAPDCESANASGRVRRGRYSGGWLSWFWGVKSNVVLGVPDSLSIPERHAVLF